MNSIEQQDHNDAESARPVSPEAAPPRATTPEPMTDDGIAALEECVNRAESSTTTAYGKRRVAEARRALDRLRASLAAAPSEETPDAHDALFDATREDAARLALGEAAREIPWVAGPVAHRIRKLRESHAEEIERLRAAGAKLLEAALEREGRYVANGYVVTYTENADLAAWLYPVDSDDKAEEVFYDDLASAFDWIASRASLRATPPAEVKP